MGAITVAGKGVTSGTLALPRVGAWVLDATVDARQISDVSGHVTVSLGSGALELKGTVVPDSRVYAGIAYLRVIGGAGGLAKTATAKYYANPTLRIPLLDLLAGAGESLSSKADANALAVRLQSWTTMAMPTGLVIGALVQSTAQGTAWRVLPDGTVWVGAEQWTQTKASYAVLTERMSEQRIHVALEEPTLLPGTTLTDGRKVSDVRLSANGGRMEADVWLEAA